LEAHVLDASDILRPLKVLTRPVLAAFPGIVNKVFGHLSQGPTFLAEVDDDAAAPLLGFLDCLFDAENEVRAACADV
jgi:hypothetical protein